MSKYVIYTELSDNENIAALPSWFHIITLPTHHRHSDLSYPDDQYKRRNLYYDRQLTYRAIAKNFHDRLLAHLSGTSVINENIVFFNKLHDFFIAGDIIKSIRLLFVLASRVIVIDYMIIDPLISNHISFNLFGNIKLCLINRNKPQPITALYPNLSSLPYEIHVMIFTMLDKRSQLAFLLINRYASQFICHVRITKRYTITKNDIGRFYYDLLANVVVEDELPVPRFHIQQS